MPFAVCQLTFAHRVLIRSVIRGDNRKLRGVVWGWPTALADGVIRGRDWGFPRSPREEGHLMPSFDPH